MYKVVPSSKYARTEKKFIKQRRSEKIKPAKLLADVKKALEQNPRDRGKPFQMHDINKYSSINMWALHLYDRYGDRMTYTIDEKTKIVTLIEIGGHEIYEEEQV